MSEEQVINCMGSKKTSERRGGHSSWVLQDKWEFARGRRLQAGGSAHWVLGVATVRFCCGVAQEQGLCGRGMLRSLDWIRQTVEVF